MNPLASSDYCLKWNDHHNVFFSTAEELCGSNILCDVSLSTGDRIFQAHKLVLSVCSPYFKKICAMSDRRDNTFIHLKNVDPRHLELILAYMYRGELTLKQTELVQFLATAKDLQIKGLSEMDQVESNTARDMCIKPEPRPDLPQNLKRKPDQSDLKLSKQLKPSYLPSPSSLPLPQPPSTSAGGFRPSPLHPMVNSPAPSPPHPGLPPMMAPQLPPSTLSSLALHLKREMDGMNASHPSPSPSTLRGESGRLGSGGGSEMLMVDEPVLPEDDDLSNLSASDVQTVHYTNTTNSTETRERSSTQHLLTNSTDTVHREEERFVAEQSEASKQPYQSTTAPARKKSTNSNSGGSGLSSTGGAGGTHASSNGPKAFQCQMCDMSFDQNWLLKRHFRTHTKERPFRCILCMKNFSLKDSCIRHIRNVHRGEIYGDASVTDLSSSYCQFDGAGGIVVGGSLGEREDLDTEMNSNEALAVAL